MSKEVGLVTIPIFIAYTFLTHQLKLRKFLIFLYGSASAVLPFFILLLTRQDAMSSFYHYAIWQMTRKANPEFYEGLSEYLNILIQEAVGYVLPVLIVVSILVIWKESKDRKVSQHKDHLILLLLTLSILFIFYASIATQADRFVITFIPPILILGCAFIVSNSVRHGISNKIIYIIIVPIVILSNNYFLSNVIPVAEIELSDHLGTTWKRAAALWLNNNTSAEVGILTYSNSFANTIRFYSNNQVYAIEDNFNPAYLIVNPVLLTLNGNVTIIVDDLTSENHSKELKRYIDFFKPKLVHTVFKDDTNIGKDSAIPAVKIYQLQ